MNSREQRLRLLKWWTGAVLAVVLSAAQPAHAQNFANWTPDEKKDAEPKAGVTVDIEKGAVTAQTPLAAEAEKSLQTGLDTSVKAPAVATFSEKDLEGLSPEELQALMGTGLIPPVTQPQAGVFSELASTYTLGPTDVIEITVMRHPEVSGQYPINSEGKIQYEFVGDVMISGMTKEAAQVAVAERLAEYIVSPEVTVKIIQYNSKIVYVVGEVAAPGKIYMRGDTITVREALMQAGLPRLSGVTKKSHLITPSEKGKPRKKYINAYALLYEGDLRENDIMYPGDLLYIPPTFLTKVMRAISPVAAPIGQAAGATTGVNVIGNPNQNEY